MMLTTSDLIIFTFSALFGASGAWAIMSFGGQSGFLDEPGHRSSHQVPTPKGGGIGILATFIIGCIWYRVALPFWLLISFVSFLGLLSDRLDITPHRRLLVQFFCAFGIIAVSYPQNDMPSVFYWFFVSASCVFIVGTANFYNFMDGINGIAGLMAVVSYGLCGYYLYSVGYESQFQLLLFCVVGGVVGFLPFNVPKARVFMGDVGSILLGFLYGCTIVLTSRTAIDFVCLTSFLFLFYADELTTMLVRLKDGESLLKAHRRHLYQVLANELGYRHWIVSTGYGLLQLAIGASVLLIMPYGMTPLLIMLFLYCCVFTLFTIWVRCLPISN
jgi:UDP-N-acetylmuramyl pentapeptide phosphotransferase/UDP-N-acetylglucosamine-1-phosphate transferase